MCVCVVPRCGALVVMTVVLGMLLWTCPGGVVGQIECDMKDMPSQCVCHHPPINIVTCSCSPGQDLTLTSLELEGVPVETNTLAISGCNRVVIQEGALIEIPDLFNISFTSLASLRLEQNSLHLDFVYHNEFFLTFDSISSLEVNDNAINLITPQERNGKERLVIRNSTITKLGKNAINGSLSELVMDNVTLTQTPGIEAINLGLEGTNIFLHALCTSNSGKLGQNWMIGNAKNLTIIKSDFALLSNAFFGIQMVSPQSSFTLLDNTIGYLKAGGENQNLNGFPSLPTKALDLKVHSETVITAQRNRLSCQCGDLRWLGEGPFTRFKKTIQDSLVCESGSIAVGKKYCDSNQAPSIRSSSMVLLVIMSGVFSLWIVY